MKERKKHPFGAYDWDSILIGGEPLWFLAPVVCDCVKRSRVREAA